MDRPSVGKRTVVLETPWRRVVEDTLHLPDGRTTRYAYIDAPDAVFVVAVTAERDVLLVRQYRHPIGAETLEVAAGAVATGETPLDAARRELREETGAVADDWIALRRFHSSSGHLSLQGHAFLARGARVAAPIQPDDDERDLRVERVPLDDALSMARDGRLTDAQTAFALLLAEPHLR